MATTATVPEVRALKRRRVIERPRLFTQLDESKARVRTLVAPAGYGKSTLAEQWVARAGRCGAWYTARSSSTDVAALALGLARACTGLVEGCDARLREHLRALPAPAENVETLAEILGEDLEAWPAEAWLVIDDYHEVAAEPKAERFVASLVAASPIQLLIASRQRPAWVSAKKILYGDVLELNQTALAMDSHEAADVLVDRSAPSASGLVSLANGWPAVIGLASVAFAEIESDAEPVPESLYRFFAEEVFSALGEDVQQGLTTLSVAPILDRELAVRLLGPEKAESVCAAALDVGILVERGAQLELHPLARAFLAERSGQLGFIPAEGAVEVCLDNYMRRREWDAAFDTIVKSERTAELGPLMRAALDELLDTARLPSIETWYEHAVQFDVDSPVVSVARAEVALRRGRYAEARAFGEVAAAAERFDLKFRALTVAGRAAHLASREEDALDLYRRAEAAASDDPERRDALWGQLRCLIDLERPGARGALDLLQQGVHLSEPAEVVRAAAHELSFQHRMGSLNVANVDVAAELLETIGDPLIESSFQSIYSTALGLSARYDDCLAVATQLLELAQRYRLDFAVPYALCAQSMAHAGLREWERATQGLSDAIGIARTTRDVHAEQVGFALNQRLLVQRGRVRSALALELPPLGGALPAARAEVLGSRALVLASGGRLEEARVMVNQIRGSTKAVEPAVVLAAVDAICALNGGDVNAVEAVVELERVAFSTGAVDLLVTAYRANPDLLAVLLHRVKPSDRVVTLVRRARDDDLADAVGYSISVAEDPTMSLSPREREVYDLLCQRLTNRQIARVLFIEESTVKLHAYHIYNKLGIRSRTTLAIQAMLERRHATSATESNDAIDDSS